MSDGAFDHGQPSSSGLLGQCALTLQSHDYETKYVAHDAGQLLLARNSLFIIGIAQFDSVSSLSAVESQGSLTLGEQLGDAGPLRWDAYLVLLTPAKRNTV